MFTRALLRRAPSKVRCIVTTRDYSELNQFLTLLGLETARIGKHGGGDIAKKLEASIAREKMLVPFVEGHSFDCSLSFLSPEAARVSFGLGIKHYVCSDSPHSNAPCRLTVSLSKEVFTPFPIKTSRWSRYGIESSLVKKYNALDPWAWIQGSNVKAGRKIQGRVMIRLEEWFASYFRKGMGVSDSLSKLVAGIERAGDYEIILVPRYDEQRIWARKNFGDVCTIPKTTINGYEEIAKTDLVVGGGATMTQEAALLGVPNISYFPSADLDVFSNYYFPKKMSIEASTTKQLLDSTFSLLKDIDKTKAAFIERAETETRNFEDPVEFIFTQLLSEN